MNAMKSGEIEVKGERLSKPTPLKCIRKGIAFVSENRHAEGLLLSKPLADNLSLVKLREILKTAGAINRKKELQTVKDLVERLRIKVTNAFRQTANSLSGDNQ